MAFASLFVPDFPVQAVVRLERELQDKPVAILAGTPPLTRVFATNLRARELGVEAGMTKIQAEAFQGITWRWRSLPREEAAYAALRDCAWTISPRIEDGVNPEGQDFRDTVVLDLAGCEKLFGTPFKIAQDLESVASKVGFEVNVAVAENISAAVCAAKGFAGVTIIPSGEERRFIGTLSLEALRMPFETIETLRRWGIRSCADFAALPEIAIVERLGQEGLRWWRLAQGAERTPLIARDFPIHFEEHMDLDCAVELLEPLLFVLNRLLDQLSTRLHLHILSIAEVKVSLQLESNGSKEKRPNVYARTLRLPLPTRDSKLLLRLLRLDLEAHPPGAPVTAVSILATPAKARSQQFGLFVPLCPDPERLEITLARIQSTVGEGRVGAPVLLDSHAPNCFRQNHFVLAEAAGKTPQKEKQPTAVMRIYRPALTATVEFAEGTPRHISCEGVRHEVLAFAGPWRRKGEWWSEESWAREEWDVKIKTLRPRIPSESDANTESDTALYRIYKDLRVKGWFIEGIYD